MLPDSLKLFDCTHCDYGIVMCVIVWAWTAYIMKTQCGCVRRHERIHDTCHCASIPRSFLLFSYTPPSLWIVLFPINLSFFLLAAQSCHSPLSHSCFYLSRGSQTIRHHVQILNKLQTQTFVEILPSVMCCEIYKWHAVLCLSFSASRLIIIINRMGGRIFELSLIWHYHLIIQRQNSLGQHGTRWMDERSLKKQTYMKHDGKSSSFRSYAMLFSVQLQGLEAFKIFFKKQKHSKIMVSLILLKWIL